MKTQTRWQVRLRRPTRSDAKAIHGLIRKCPPLDENSCYAYLLLCEHFADTCVVAELDGEFAGFVSAYIPPANPEVVFVWQVAVSPSARGCGLGGAMLLDLVLRAPCLAVRYIETTVSPSNEASARLFEKLAEKLKAACHRELLFGADAFSDPGHEDEVLFRIGPLQAAAG